MFLRRSYWIIASPDFANTRPANLFVIVGSVFLPSNAPTRLQGSRFAPTMTRMLSQADGLGILSFPLPQQTAPKLSFLCLSGCFLKSISVFGRLATEPLPGHASYISRARAVPLSRYGNKLQFWLCRKEAVVFLVQSRFCFRVWGWREPRRHESLGLCEGDGCAVGNHIPWIYRRHHPE